MPTQPTIRRPTTSRPTRALSKSKPADKPTPDELAAKLAAGLTISDKPNTPTTATTTTKSKGKRKATDDERRIEAMRAVDTASRCLATFVQAGWKASAPPPPPSSKGSSPAANATNAVKWINELRELCPGGLDVERAAGSVVGKLLALEMYDAALVALSEMHPRLCALYDTGTPPPSSKSKPPAVKVSRSSPLITASFHLLALPLPPASSVPLDHILLTLLSTYLLHALTALTRLLPSIAATDAFAAIVDSNTPTLLTWAHYAHLPDALLTRAYTALTRPLPAHPRALLRVRVYALHCLLCTTVEPGTLWDQATKVCASFAKSVPVEEQELLGGVLEALDKLVGAAERRADREAFLAGGAFVTFCECWMGFAKRMKDVNALDRIAQLMKSSAVPSPSSSTSSNPTPSSSEDRLIRQSGEQDRRARKAQDAAASKGAHMCAVFAQATTALEQFTASENHSNLEILDRHIYAAAALCSSIPPLHRANVHAVAATKVDRALERLRRAGIKTLDISPATGAHDAIRQLMIAIVDALEAARSPDTTAPALDTLFVLARTTLQPDSPDTYALAYDFLARAVALLDEASANPEHMRCAASIFHSTGGALFHADRYGAAVRFLKEGCKLGKRALETRERVEEREAKEGGEESWRVLKEQLFRRWELLAVCYAKIGERKAAYDAFVDSVKTFPFAGMDMARGLSTSSSLRQLGAIVDRLTLLGACELLLSPTDLALSAYFPASSTTLAAGALLERQIAALAAKASAQATVRVLLEEALKVYKAEVTPIRRARVLVRSLEVAYFAGPEAGVGEEVGVEALELLSREDLRADDGLALFRSEYLAAARLWLGLHAHRRVDARQVELVGQHVEEAGRALRALLALAAGIPSPKMKKSPKGQGKVAVAKRAVAGRTVRVREPVTPKPRKALEMVSMNGIQATPPRPVGETKKPLLEFDDFDKLLGLLQMSCHLLGLMGLVLAKVQLLDLTRRLCQLQAQSTDDGYVTASVELAHEYVKLGKTGKASAIYGQALHAIRNGNVSDEIRTRFLLYYAESLAGVDNVLRSSSTYCEALGLSESLIDEEKGVSTMQRVRARVCRLERAAIAARTFAVIQYAREDTTSSLAGLLQSYRLWNRALDALARLSPALVSPKPIAEESNPFAMSSLKDALPDNKEASRREASPVKKEFQRKFSMEGLEWRIADGLLSTLFALSQTYFTRGSAREAEYFAQQALDFAESINAPAMASRALARKGEVQLYQGQLQEGYQTLMQAAELVEGVPGADAADVHRLRGDYSQRSEKHKNAQQLYAEATTILEELDKMFGALEILASGPRKSTGLSPKPPATLANDSVVPVLRSVVLRQHIWLLRDDGGAEYRTLLERFLALPSSYEIKAEENALMAMLTLHDVYARFRADMFFSSIAESTIALPMGMSGDKLFSLSPSAQEILTALNNAEKLLWADLALIGRRGRVTHVRNAAVSLALIGALQTSLGKTGKAGPVLAANLLDASTAITLRREMLETIHHKFLNLQMSDDLQWPLITPNGSPLSRPVPRAQPRFRSVPDSDDETEDAVLNDVSLQQYWGTIREKYSAHTLDAVSLSTPQANALPAHWTVINISLTDDKSTLFVTRQKAHREPLIFCVPLKGRRESDEDGYLTFDDALKELREIIQLSDDSTRQAANIKNNDPQARGAWWAERSALDKRMQELLENIEFCWLGAFKTILSQPRKMSPDVIADLRTRFDKVFKRSLHSQDKKQKTRIKLGDALLECFSSLSPKCRDEELEDLIYFILDLYQFHGAPIAISEVDIDQVAVELRTALEEHNAKTKSEVVAEDDGHMFLVLDKNVQGIPWESIPILRGKSVSRIPSIEFLVDRLQFARWEAGLNKPEVEAAEENALDRAMVDPRKAYYVLNPSGDLKGTEGRFSTWLEGMKPVGWQGVIGTVPSEQQLLDALSRNDLVIYFGHGGAEQYIRSHKIRHLPRCAVTMLWGCSSGALRDMGDFDRVGTPYNYMLAGCPTLVANLWDVTDRDIDKFSQSVFDKMRLRPDDVRKWTPNADTKTSVVSAVAESREGCKLKYLTGAAPVVYGIPFYL